MQKQVLKECRLVSDAQIPLGRYPRKQESLIFAFRMKFFVHDYGSTEATFIGCLFLDLTTNPFVHLHCLYSVP